jgi:acetolactate synthase-1/2/3 large subunit
MTVEELIAEAVVAEGVDVVFCVMGDGNMHWLSVLEAEHDVRIIQCRHEAMAAGMAESYARVTGKPGVCSVTCGPGLALVGLTLMIASRNRTPLLVIAGDTPRSDPYYQQRFDQRRFVETSEAVAVDLRTPGTAAMDIRAAFVQTRLSQPVVLGAAFDIQAEDIPEQAGPYRPSTTLVTPPQAISPDESVVAEAARLLADAKRPAIVGGRGAIGARAEIEALADQTGALLGTTLKAKGLFEGHPRHVGVVGGLSSGLSRSMLREADCVLAIGAGLNQYTTEAGGMAPDATIIQVSLEPHELIHGRRLPVDRPGGDARADCYVQGDAARTVALLREALPLAPAEDAGWTQLLDGYDAPDMAQPAFELAEGTVHPRDAMKTLSEVAAEGTRYVVGLGHHWWFGITFLTGGDASSYLFIPEMAAIGQTFGAALGASVAEPGRPVVLVEGDGSLMMGIQEIDTAVRNNIDIVVVVMNDNGLAAEFHRLDADGAETVGPHIPAPDYARVAEAFGARGYRAESLDDLRSAVIEAQAAGGPAVIDVKISDKVINDWFWLNFYADRPAAVETT